MALSKIVILLDCVLTSHSCTSYDGLTGNAEPFIVTQRLHYVPGDHGSHGSPKRSAPCDLVNFCLGAQVLLSIITFCHGLSRYPLQTVG